MTTALGAVLFALIGLAACGGIPGDAVVSVDGKSITKETFNHWMGVAAASSAKTACPVSPTSRMHARAASRYVDGGSALL